MPEKLDFSKTPFRDIVRFDNSPRDEFNLYFTMGSYCPLHCSYCTQGGRHDVEDFDEALELASHFHKLKGYLDGRRREGNRMKLHLIGGEPAYYPVERIVQSMGLRFDELCIISNFIRPNSWYDGIEAFCKEQGMRFSVQVSLHLNRVPASFYERKIAQALPKGYVRDIIYVVEEDEGKLREAIALSRKLGVFAELHRMRLPGNLPLEERCYSEGIEKLLLGYEEESGLHGEFHATATLKDGRECAMPALGDLSTYYPNDDLYGLYCDIARHSLRVNERGEIGLAPVCKAYVAGEDGRVLDIRTCGNLDGLGDCLPSYIRCPCPVCPMNAKETLRRGFPKDGILPKKQDGYRLVGA